jgi:hypothetical protein
MSRLSLANLAVVTLLAGATLLVGGGFLLLGALSADPGAGHRPGHIGCPPGSHGKPWSADVGRKLNDALSRRDQPAGNSPTTLADRALTAGRTAR